MTSRTQRYSVVVSGDNSLGFDPLSEKYLIKPINKEVGTM